MAHFAEIDSNGNVTRVLVVPDEQQSRGQAYLADDLGLGGTWVQTSYNTRGGKHYGADGQPDGGTQVNYNYAGVGYVWDGTGFHAPQPFPSWTLDKTTYLWEAPVAMPTDGKFYEWNETNKSWDVVTPPQA